MTRPMLLPAVRRFWRDSRTVQFGLDPDRGLTIEFGHPSVIRLLDLLDGSRSEAAVYRDAGALGIRVEDTTCLLESLRRAGLVISAEALLPAGLTLSQRQRLLPEALALALRTRPGDQTPAQLLRGRLTARVRITGGGRLVGPIATSLAAAGVGRIEPAVTGTVRAGEPTVGGVLPADLRRPRRRAIADAILRTAPHADVLAVPDGEADLVVIVGQPRPATLDALAYALRHAPHLAVSVRDGTVVIGPLVRPGQSPCLHCVQLYRQERDPSWPALVAQLATGPEVPEPVETAVSASAVGLVVREALAQLDGAEPVTLGGTVELGPDCVPRRRSWPAHPRCGCLTPRRRSGR